MNGTGEFELSLLQGPLDAAAAPPIVTPAQVNLLTSLEDVVAATNSVAASAQRLMSICTPDLEPELYDQTAFLEILKRFVLARSFAKVRVLIGDGSRLSRDAHRLVALSRRLSSYIEFRILGADAPSPMAGYLIADDRAIVFRANASHYDGVADLNNPAVAHVHLSAFDEQWLSHGPKESSYRVARR